MHPSTCDAGSVHCTNLTLNNYFFILLYGTKTNTQTLAADCTNQRQWASNTGSFISNCRLVHAGLVTTWSPDLPQAILGRLVMTFAIAEHLPQFRGCRMSLNGESFSSHHFTFYGEIDIQISVDPTSQRSSTVWNQLKLICLDTNSQESQCSLLTFHYFCLFQLLNEVLTVHCIKLKIVLLFVTVLKILCLVF